MWRPSQSGGSWVSEEKKKEKEKKQGDGFLVHGCSHFRKLKQWMSAH
jgi:hypothetical protein